MWSDLSVCLRRGRPRSVVGTNGAVAADTGTCSQVGLDILQAGGNAVDAGVVSHHCCVFTMCVLDPIHVHCIMR